MAKYGPLFTYWSKDYKTDLFEVIDRCSQAGADCTEMHTYLFEDWSKEKRGDFVKKCKDSNVEIAHWCGFTPQTNVMSSDKEIREAAVESIIKYIKLASEMQGKILDGTYVQTWNFELEEGRTRKQALEDAIECLRKAVPAAEDYGITLCMEILNRFEGALVNTMSEALQIINAVKSPNLKITADIFHMNIEEDSITEAVEAGGSNMGHVHIGEANRRLPGKGKMIDWDLFFQCLKNVNYNGMFIFEAFVLPGGSVAKDVKLRRDLSNGASVETMTKELETSIKFVKNKFENA